MPSPRSALLFALLLSACAAHEGPVDPPTPTARVEVKVASVQLVQDCSDPPGEAEAEAAARDAAGKAVLAQAGSPAQPMPPEPGVAQQRVAAGSAAFAGDSLVGGWTPPCTQSTIQLSVANVGDREGKVRVEAVRLLDARNQRELDKIGARKPSQWNPAGTYQPWNEVVPVGATVKVGYRLGEPDWTAVGNALAGADPYTQPYMLEIDVSVDGISQTVRSPEFMREPVHVIVT